MHQRFGILSIQCTEWIDIIESHFLTLLSMFHSTFLSYANFMFLRLPFHKDKISSCSIFDTAATVYARECLNISVKPNTSLLKKFHFPYSDITSFSFRDDVIGAKHIGPIITTIEQAYNLTDLNLDGLRLGNDAVLMLCDRLITSQGCLQ
eukprot:PhF_6_TR11574/c0_g2_i2/m.18683